MTVRERAGTVLGVPSDAPPSEVRAAFLHQLAGEGFAPSEKLVWASQSLSGMKLPLSATARTEAAATEAEVVDGFAREYWSLPPDVRRERWDSLHESLSDPKSISRMADLEAGLGVDSPPHEDPHLETVATAIRELFVLRPRERIIRRTGWLLEHFEEQELRSAARRFRIENHGLNGLVPTLAVQLESETPLRPLDPMLSIRDPAEGEAYDAVARAGSDSVRTSGPLRGRKPKKQIALSLRAALGGLIVLLLVVVFLDMRRTRSVPEPPPLKFERYERDAIRIDVNESAPLWNSPIAPPPPVGPPEPIRSPVTGKLVLPKETR